MTKATRPHRRGSLVLGLVLLVFVLITFCGLVLSSSLEMYRDQTLMERRLQARAGLEAVIAALGSDPAIEEVDTLSGSTFSASCGEPDITGDVLRRSVSVEVLGGNGEPVYSDTQIVVFRKLDNDWHYARTER